MKILKPKILMSDGGEPLYSTITTSYQLLNMKVVMSWFGDRGSLRLTNTIEPKVSVATLGSC